MAPRSLGAENPEARTGPDGTGVRGLRSVSRSGEHASGAFRPRQQAVDPVVDGRGAGLGLLREWPVHVVRAVHGVAIHQHDGKPELVALIERGADFVAGDGDDVGALGAALDLDVARFRQYAVGDRRLRGYVPAAFFRGHVGDDVAARALGGDDGLHGTLLDRGARSGWPRSLASKPAGITSAPPSTTGVAETMCRCDSSSRSRACRRAASSSARLRRLSGWMRGCLPAATCKSSCAARWPR